jgi:hypothetical protein
VRRLSDQRYPADIVNQRGQPSLSLLEKDSAAWEPGFLEKGAERSDRAFLIHRHKNSWFNKDRTYCLPFECRDTSQSIEISAFRIEQPNGCGLSDEHLRRDDRLCIKNPSCTKIKKIAQKDAGRTGSKRHQSSSRGERVFKV